MFRALVDAGAELVLIPAAWPATRVEHWSLLSAARAVEDQVVVVATNTAGWQAGKQMGGRSMVVDAQGRVLVEAGDGAERLSVDVDLDGVRAWRERFRGRQERGSAHAMHVPRRGRRPPHSLGGVSRLAEHLALRVDHRGASAHLLARLVAGGVRGHDHDLVLDRPGPCQ